MISGRQKKKKWMMIAVGLLLVALVYLILILVQITTVEVDGNHQYTQEQMTDILFDTKWSRSSIYYYIQSVIGKKKTIPFVEDYKITFKSPTHVKVIVYEKSVVGYVSYMSSYMYFDKDGLIVESSSQKLEGVPQITGLKFGQIVLYQPLPVSNTKIFDEILNLTQILSLQEIQVDKIHYNAALEAELTIKDLVVKMGTNAQMNGKVSELSNILKDYVELAGTLYLDVYDEANSNPMYRFEKRE